MWFKFSIISLVVLVVAPGCSLLERAHQLPLTQSNVADDKQPAPAQAVLVAQAKLAVQAGESAERQEDFDDAIRYYRQAIELNTENYDLHKRLAFLYDQTGQDQLAQDAYERALAGQPNDAQVLNDYGVYHLHRENGKEAEQLFRRALAIQGDQPRTTNNLAIALAMQGRLEESLDVFESVVGAPAAHANLGVLLARQGRVADAKTHLQKALNLDASIGSATKMLAQLDERSDSSKSVTGDSEVSLVSFQSELTDSQ